MSMSIVIKSVISTLSLVMSALSPPPQAAELLEAFRLHFQQYHRAVNEAVSNQTDEVVLTRLFDDLQEYAALVNKYTHVFPADELATLQTNLALMLNDVRIQYQQALDASHHGHASVVETIHTGCNSYSLPMITVPQLELGASSVYLEAQYNHPCCDKDLYSHRQLLSPMILLWMSHLMAKLNARTTS
ncbi:hypothetical protein K438DRAFT_1953185 [Mycena galopus ATCC 62051]|nr:hypothetical protein K438DRAFT_1953185 [Mycena galopus ATCC 62051]